MRLARAEDLDAVLHVDVIGFQSEPTLERPSQPLVVDTYASSDACCAGLTTPAGHQHRHALLAEVVSGDPLPSERAEQHRNVADLMAAWIRRLRAARAKWVSSSVGRGSASGTQARACAAALAARPPSGHFRSEVRSNKAWVGNRIPSAVRMCNFRMYANTH
jgi:hypothetical protein